MCWPVCYIISFNPRGYHVTVVISTVLWMKKLRQKEVNELAPGHTASTRERS